MKYLFIFLFIFINILIFAQSNHVLIHPNQGQWDNQILYKVELNNGEILLNNKEIAYVLTDATQKFGHHHESKEETHLDKETFRYQIVKTEFLNSSWKGLKRESIPSSEYRNYYIGNDPSNWVSNVFSYEKVVLDDFYNGIDLEYDGTSSQLKYSFHVKPNADVTSIKLKIAGSNKIEIDRFGRLIITTEFGEIIEEKPKAWNLIENKKRLIDVNYKIEEGILTYEFPNGYDKNHLLVIDPTLTFSTFTGSSMDNWGMTATPDPSGNLISGGIVFSGVGNYPTTVGAFDVTMNGGDQSANPYGGFDAVITKFNSTGTNLIYSTFLGGSANEAPHSLVCDNNGDLYVYGVTSSSNFPTTSGAFDNSFNGGPYFYENELGYNGADIFISHFNSNGIALVGSTFIGGTGTDGINSGALNYNYGDPFRGEIIVDNAGFVYISTTTSSSNFPLVSPIQGSLSGAQDAVILKINSNLTTISWSTYFGGTSLESGNSLQLSSNGFLYLVGGTNSNSLPFNSGLSLSNNGGVSDGYIAKFNSLTGVLLSGTFVGMSEYDQIFFVQLDNNNDVYVYGQTESNYPISQGCYGNANSGQFIRKYNPNLTTILWTTMIGAGTGHVEISPTAFLVSNCGDIYISGWGGQINSQFGNQASYSTTNGFSVTNDAYQATTNGSNFYIAMLNSNASSLKYATYIGGANSSYNHVDGGTSRFDKNGKIYHAVCAACGGDANGFTSTPGVYSPTNNSSNCNLAAFKFELNSVQTTVSAPQSYVCMPNPVVFTGNSPNGNVFHWDFGDGTTANEINVSHVYAGPGNYTVTLTASDSTGCLAPSIYSFEVAIGDFQGGVIQPTSPICFGKSYQLEAYGGKDYLWSPAQFLDDATSPTPTATITQTTNFSVIVSDTCGVDTVYVTLQVYPTIAILVNDTSICLGQNVQLHAYNSVVQTWNPPNFLDDPTSANPICSATNTITYQVEMTTIDNCIFDDSVKVTVYTSLPVPEIQDTAFVCLNQSKQIIVGGAEYYSWYPNININQTDNDTVIITPEIDDYYYCIFTNACGSTLDSIYVLRWIPDVQAGNDTTICVGDSTQLWSSGAIKYNWYPYQYINDPLISNPIVFPKNDTTYKVIGIDINGCIDSAFVRVNLFPEPQVNVESPIYASLGDQVQLEANSEFVGTYVWTLNENLSCDTCQRTIANPDRNFTYIITLTDTNGCQATDQVILIYDGIIYVPNTFTPNDGDSFNPMFLAVGENINNFKMEIFDRWGELIFTSNSIQQGWDGKYLNQVCPIGTYTWKIYYSDFKNKQKEIIGHINLVR